MVCKTNETEYHYSQVIIAILFRHFSIIYNGNDWKSISTWCLNFENVIFIIVKDKMHKLSNILNEEFEEDIGTQNISCIVSHYNLPWVRCLSGLLVYYRRAWRQCLIWKIWLTFKNCNDCNQRHNCQRQEVKNRWNS